jgi:phage tail-like protein
VERAEAVRFLNLDLSWPGFETTNLERRADGSLTLARVPLLVDVLGDGDPGPVDPAAPLPQVATTPDCTCDLFVTDPSGHRLWRFDACENAATALPLLRGPGALPGTLNIPTGVAIAAGPNGQRLYVAEAGNHRIQVIELETQQPLSVWGQSDPYAPPEAGSDPGQLSAPLDLAVDAAGDVYVVDRGNNRVQRFSPRGEVRPEFWTTLSADPAHPEHPRRIAIAATAGVERIYILDDGAVPRVIIANLVDNQQPLVSWPIETAVQNPVALAVIADTVYIGGAAGAIARYTSDGQLMAVLPGPGRPAAAVAAGGYGELLAGGPAGLPIARYQPDGGFLPLGNFRVGPIYMDGTDLAWHRWRVAADPLVGNAHLQLFTTSADADPPSMPPGTLDDPFAGWFAEPRDELEVLVLSEQVREALAEGPPPLGQPDDEGGQRPAHIWLGGILSGDGTASPILRQMRVEQTPITAIASLPALYRDGARRRLPLDLLLATFESELALVRETLDDMPRKVDPAGTPAEWLPWLASWLDLELNEEWPEPVQRQAIAEAMVMHARRGTVEGLRALIKRDAGVEARIEEPGAMVSLFALDGQAVLGFTTGLASGDPNGAILGTTAILGESDLTTVEEIGAPLFDDVAHRFRVLVYAVELLDPETRPRIQRVLDREKPAHTDFELCAIGPRMRIGVQARLGIDAIIAGFAPAPPLDEGSELGIDTALPNDPRWSGRRIGRGIRVGVTL